MGKLFLGYQRSSPPSGVFGRQVSKTVTGFENHRSGSVRISHRNQGFYEVSLVTVVLVLWEYVWTIKWREEEEKEEEGEEQKRGEREEDRVQEGRMGKRKRGRTWCSHVSLLENVFLTFKDQDLFLLCGRFFLYLDEQYWFLSPFQKCRRGRSQRRSRSLGHTEPKVFFRFITSSGLQDRSTKPWDTQYFGIGRVRLLFVDRLIIQGPRRNLRLLDSFKSVSRESLRKPAVVQIGVCVQSPLLGVLSPREEWSDWIWKGSSHHPFPPPLCPVSTLQLFSYTVQYYPRHVSKKKSSVGFFSFRSTDVTTESGFSASITILVYTNNRWN